MRDYKKAIVATSLFFLTAQVVLCQQDCVLKKEKDDLKVYICESASEKLKTLKTELILENTSLRKLLDFVMDIDNYVNWQYNTIEATILKRTSSRSIVYRTVVRAPWPALNREMIAEIIFNYDSAAQQLFITSHGVTYDYPEDEELVRVPFTEGTWRVSSFKGSSLKIEWTLRIDPGGSVPSWLVNIAMAEGPYYSFIKLKEKLQQQSGAGIPEN